MLLNSTTIKKIILLIMIFLKKPESKYHLILTNWNCFTNQHEISW